jgi:cell division protein FtsL
MAKHLPDHHSPLMALGKKVLLWVILPAALVLTAIYVVDTELPARQKVKRAAQEIAKKRVEELSRVNARAEKLKASLATPTTVEELQRTFQLLGEELKGDELERVRNMSNSERAEFKQKKIDRLSLSEKNAYARKLNEWAQKRWLSPNPA